MSCYLVAETEDRFLLWPSRDLLITIQSLGAFCMGNATA
jgi:hypothetical protein